MRKFIRIILFLLPSVTLLGQNNLYSKNYKAYEKYLKKGDMEGRMEYLKKITSDLQGDIVDVYDFQDLAIVREFGSTTDYEAIIFLGELELDVREKPVSFEGETFDTWKDCEVCFYEGIFYDVTQDEGGPTEEEVRSTYLFPLLEAYWMTEDLTGYNRILADLESLLGNETWGERFEDNNDIDGLIDRIRLFGIIEGAFPEEDFLVNRLKITRQYSLDRMVEYVEFLQSKFTGHTESWQPLLLIREIKNK